MTPDPICLYLVALPKPEPLGQIIETDRAAWEQHHPQSITPRPAMSYYAHTADGPDGKPAGVEHWQLLKDHLPGVADHARQFARPLDLDAEAELAGLLHDVGKYAARFQARLRNPAVIHGVNHWAAGLPDECCLVNARATENTPRQFGIFV